MSTEYNSFAAQAFGPVLAEVAREDYGGRITPELIQRAVDGWGLTPAALAAVIAECRRLLV